MKRLEPTSAEIRALRDMGIFHNHPRTRMPAQAIVRLLAFHTVKSLAGILALRLLEEGLNPFPYTQVWSADLAQGRRN